MAGTYRRSLSNLTSRVGRRPRVLSELERERFQGRVVPRFCERLTSDIGKRALLGYTEELTGRPDCTSRPEWPGWAHHVDPRCSSARLPVVDPGPVPVLCASR